MEAMNLLTSFTSSLVINFHKKTFHLFILYLTYIDQNLIVEHVRDLEIKKRLLILITLNL